jgi:glutamine amidotransferase
MGWNQIYNLKSPLFDGIAENEYMYLVHSFMLQFALKLLRLQIMKWNMHQLCKDNFYGTQFHPEKSGDVGEKF